MTFLGNQIFKPKIIVKYIYIFWTTGSFNYPFGVYKCNLKNTCVKHDVNWRWMVLLKNIIILLAPFEFRLAAQSLNGWSNFTIFNRQFYFKRWTNSAFYLIKIFTKIRIWKQNYELMSLLWEVPLEFLTFVNF